MKSPVTYNGLTENVDTLELWVWPDGNYHCAGMGLRPFLHYCKAYANIPITVEVEAQRENYLEDLDMAVSYTLDQIPSFTWMIWKLIPLMALAVVGLGLTTLIS